MQPFGWYRALMSHPQYRWLAIIGSIIYLVSPLDLSPDVIPVIGQLDDVVLLMLLFSSVMQTFLPSADSGYDNSPESPQGSSDDPTVQTVDVKATSVD